MLFNGFVIEEKAAKYIKEYDVAFHGKEIVWGMKRLHVYRNLNAPKPTIDTDVNGTKYMVSCLYTDGLMSTSTFFSINSAEEYVNDIVNKFYAHENRVMGIEINYKSQYSY